jgi:hypothetical protein
MRFLLRWTLVSAIALGNMVILAVLGVVLRARALVGTVTGTGLSPSEWATPYVSLITASALTGFIALAGTALYWGAGLLWDPAVAQGGRGARLMKLSLLAVPLWFVFLSLAIRLQGRR